MAGRLVLFGATGYTGRLTAEALVRRGARPVLAARSEERVRAMADELGGGLETATADVSRPDSVRALVERGDVLLSTVGPFVRWGEPAVQAAIGSGATYVDSTGEPPFIRAVFERYGPGAQSAGCALITAFGFDWVPGNLAGAVALERAGDGAVRLVIAYYATGSGGGFSGGTQASTIASMFEPGFAWRGGRLVTERPAARVRSFEVRGRSRPAVSVSSSEHFALPRLAAGLREVDVYLGWFGGMSRPIQVFSAVTDAVTRFPGARGALGAAAGRFVKGSTGGPGPQERAKVGSHVAARAYDAAGSQLAEAVVTGVDGYSFTGEMLAWGAMRALEGGVSGTGALGPVEAFGLHELRAGAESAGLRVEDL